MKVKSSFWFPALTLVGVAGCLYFLSDIFLGGHSKVFHWVISRLSDEWVTGGPRPAWAMYALPAMILVILVAGLVFSFIAKANSKRSVRVVTAVALAITVPAAFFLVKDLVLAIPSTMFALCGIIGAILSNRQRAER